MADEAIYNPATGDYSVPEGGGGINVGVGALPPLPTLGGSYSADGTNNASPDILQWIGTLSGIGTSWYRAVATPTASSVPGAARTPTPGNLTGSTTAAQSAGVGTLVVVFLVAILVYIGVKRR